MNQQDFVELFNQIRKIRSDIERIESTQAVLVRGQYDALVPKLVEALTDDAALGKTYLAVDGKRSQQEIAREASISPQSVGSKLKKLDRDLHLIVLADRNTSGKIYERGPLEDIVHLSDKVRKNLPQ